MDKGAPPGTPLLEVCRTHVAPDTCAGPKVSTSKLCMRDVDRAIDVDAVTSQKFLEFCDIVTIAYELGDAVGFAQLCYSPQPKVIGFSPAASSQRVSLGCAAGLAFPHHLGAAARGR